MNKISAYFAAFTAVRTIPDVSVEDTMTAVEASVATENIAI